MNPWSLTVFVLLPAVGGVVQLWNAIRLRSAARST